MIEKKYLVMGLGLHGGGLGVAKWLAEQGHPVLITDLKNQRELAASLAPLKKFKNITYRLGQHQLSDFQNAAVVIANPSVRQDNKYLLAAKKVKAKIYNDLSFFLTLCPCPVIGITGTKGKSTTATLIYQLLKTGQKKKVYLGGNIRISPFSFLSKLTTQDLVVLEFSSWQCEGLKSIKYSPSVAILTNVGQDHLNTYKNFTAYRNAKLLLFKYQTKKDWAIINRDDRASQQATGFIVGKIKKFSLSHGDNYVKNNYLYYQQRKLMSIDQLKLTGQYNIANMIAALYVAQIYHLSLARVRIILKNFSGLPGRRQLIRVWQGRKFVNDTTATSPLATITSLQSSQQPIILIAGGMDKSLSYNQLAKTIQQKVDFLLLLPGSATDKIKPLLKRLSYKKYQEVSSLAAAVKIAKQKSKPTYTILLSPAAASFNLFINEFDRGDQFNKLVNQKP
ncbi:MAG: UDP-N-acetylmuramoyl-L-alanine--D-glutamate ligase [Candidatus Komeilibacteria bacterium CG_4_10_14_0_2_um_filter_37_10]|uniref:UDP-N-acetylmuramoylalanine--D-glutamate ligase n=1 Tax=Candidatus Komeilibacteria bacterium CG_4_10_14_0_2_um_filter_37_10 TaxID=1974470 RepID=A0A2M7VDS8_9BACT|nr:MAG: UDP-N-acetylmuramoyl-L-alanine--D-glutamate ligase [Candidatus Komeilibacteria bacterium CG_4_10_14_0_2_um_filter_37_10]